MISYGIKEVIIDKSMIKVSICIPTYNQADFTRRAINSVLEQEFNDYEIIITDDSYNDDIKNLVKKIGSKKIEYFKNKQTLGSPENWNHAITKARGDYVKILHHDDWLIDKYSLGSFVKLLEDNPNVDLAFSATKRYVDGKYNSIYFPEKKIQKLTKSLTYLYPENLIGSPSATIIRNSVKTNFDKKLKWVVDIDWYFEILRTNPLFAFSSKPLICTSSGSHTVTASCENNRDIEIYEWLYLYNKIYPRFGNVSFHKKHIKQLIKKYKIKSVKEIKQYNLDLNDTILEMLEKMIRLNRYGVL